MVESSGPAHQIPCPRCGQILHVIQRGVSGRLVSYRCTRHGSFWINRHGNLKSSDPAEDIASVPISQVIYAGLAVSSMRSTVTNRRWQV